MKIEPGAKVTPNVVLVRRLGEGGMAEVWVAQHSALGTEVAVKFLHGDYVKDPAVQARFAREAATAAQVNSAHVVKIYDHGLTDTGEPFIVMELLEGTDLAQRIAEGPLPHATVLSIVGQLAKALERAHEKGVIHRDIKPENVFLTTEAGEVFVKLLDFGIAKTGRSLHDRTTGGRQSTLVGETLGTPFYMSPEQFRDSKNLDARTDLYSLGIVTYEALTGKLPFVADTLSALAIMVNEGKAVPPTELDPSLPKSVDAWFAKACALDPADRFGSPREMGNALRAAFGEAPPSLDSGSFRRVVVSIPGLSAAELKDTAFATSTATTAKPRSRNGILVAVIVGVVGLGGAAVWAVGRAQHGGGTVGPDRSGTAPVATSAAVLPAVVSATGSTASGTTPQPAVSAMASTTPSSSSARPRPSSATPTPSTKATQKNGDIW